MYFTGDSLHLSAPWVAPLDRDVGADRRTRTSAPIILRPGTASVTRGPRRWPRDARAKSALHHPRRNRRDGRDLPRSLPGRGVPPPRRTDDQACLAWGVDVCVPLLAQAEPGTGDLAWSAPCRPD